MRKALAPGFSEKAIKGNEGIMQGYVGLLIAKDETDILWWLQCAAADLIGHVTFGDGFHAL